MIKITIDGKELEVSPGTTVLEAALAHGIDIPYLCHHPELKPSGGCRLCVVEIKGGSDPQPSCGLVCQNGMVVHTESERLAQIRRDIIDLFLSDHPLNCVTCDKNGACELQRYAYRYRLSKTSFDFELARTLYQDDNPFFVRDHQYCILCGRCVRVCDEVVGANAIDFAGQGFDCHIATPFDRGMVDSGCVFCGNCVQICPTAALLPKSRLGQGREWELERKRTICGYCGVGCGIEFALAPTGPGYGGTEWTRRILYARGFSEAPVNGEFLCIKGRYGWDFVTSPDRLTQPLVRRDLAYELGLSDEPWSMPDRPALKERKAIDFFIPVSWETALDIVANQLTATVQEHGPDAVAGLTSARCTNEENYLFQKLMRATIGTNNVDHCARLWHSSTVTGLVATFGSGAMTNTIRGLRDCDCILITGSNTAESHPVISYEVVRAVKKGAHLIVIDPREIPMVKHATLWLRPKPGTDIYLYLAMAHVIVREGWVDSEFIAARTEGYEEFARAVGPYTPAVAALETGVPAEDIQRAARLYALGERASGQSIYSDERGHSAILYAMGITRRSNGTDVVVSLANLAMLCGQVGKPSTGVNPLRGQPNAQGACDLGGLPGMLPGYQRVIDEAKRRAVAAAWGLEDLPAKPGLTVVEMMQAAAEGQVRAMYIMGENPLLPNSSISHVEEALRSLDFLVVQEIFLSETAQLAHVVLPAASWLEKDGTFTNTERRVQLLEAVLPSPGKARPDWQILCDLGQLLERKLGRESGTDAWGYFSTADIMHEIVRVTPIYAGMSHRRLGVTGLQWPCPADDHPGTPVMYTETFTRGRGKFYITQPGQGNGLQEKPFPSMDQERASRFRELPSATRHSRLLRWYWEVTKGRAANESLAAPAEQ